MFEKFDIERRMPMTDGTPEKSVPGRTKYNTLGIAGVESDHFGIKITVGEPARGQFSTVLLDTALASMLVDMIKEAINEKARPMH